MKKRCLTLLLAVIFSCSILPTAYAKEIVYIDSSSFSSLPDGTALTGQGKWSYSGKAENAEKTVGTENGKTHVRLASSAPKNGYWLYWLDNEIMGDGRVEFEFRMKEGALSFLLGEGTPTKHPDYTACRLTFDSNTGKVTVFNTPMATQLIQNSWYRVVLDFNSSERTYRVQIQDAAGQTVLANETASFPTTSPIRYVSSIAFHNADQSPFELHIRSLSYQNLATGLPNGNTTSLSKDGVIQNTFPESEKESQRLIDEKPFSPRQMEYLNRGAVAIKRAEDVYLSWRWLGTEDITTGYHIYRDGVRLTQTPVKDSTNYIDRDGTVDSVYTIKAVAGGIEVDDSGSIPVVNGTYLRIPLVDDAPDDIHYQSDDGMVGDLDGDGEYELIVKRYPDDILSHSYYPLLQAYKLDGTLLWSMNLGPNEVWPVEQSIMVYDLDGDGKSEVTLRIGDGFTDGMGQNLGDLDRDGMIDYRYSLYDNKYFQEGPEYLAVFDGETGGYLAGTPYAGAIARDPLDQWASDGRTTHRPWKFFLTPVRLDDDGMSFVAARGIYGKTGMQAWKYRNGTLTQLWEFDSTEHVGYSGQGNHNMSAGDVDFDGYDEIVYASMAVDHDGSPLYTTRLGHGDAMHLGDFDPGRPGLEVMQVHENADVNVNTEFRDARTGELLWGIPAGKDVGRGLCDDFDPRYPGGESGANGIVFDTKGTVIDSYVNPNFAIWWDGDLLREFYDDITVSKYMAYDDQTIPLLKAEGCRSNNGTKANCTIQADILGDWREELVLPSSDGKELRIYISDAPTSHKVYTLMHDPIYRIGIAWQNNAYNQPPHTGFYLGYDMTRIPVPQIYTIHNGVRTESPAFYGTVSYPITRQEGAFSSSDGKTLIVDDFPRLSYDGQTQTVSKETPITYDIIHYYDRILSFGGKPDSVIIPGPDVTIQSGTRIICDTPYQILDSDGIRAQQSDSIHFDSENGMLSLKDGAPNQWVTALLQDGSRQLLHIIGGEETGEHDLIRDTFDQPPIASGSDFLPSQANTNGWKQGGASDSVQIQSIADANKKREILLSNHASNGQDAYFYLSRPEILTKGKVHVGFDIRIRPSESGTLQEGEFLLKESSDASSQGASLALYQKGNALYAGSGSTYRLLCDRLDEMTSKYGGLYRIEAMLDFNAKTYDVLLTKDGGLVSSLYALSFFDTAERGISTFALKALPGSQIGLDDISISVSPVSSWNVTCSTASGTKTDDIRLAAQIDSVSVSEKLIPSETATVFVALYDESGTIVSVVAHDISKTTPSVSIETPLDTMVTDYRLFLWDASIGMHPLL